MSRLHALKRLSFAALVTVGIVVACRSAQPGESPPLGPRPEPAPVSDPVPGAPDPLDPTLPGPPEPDAGMPLPPTSAAPQEPASPRAPVTKVSTDTDAPPVFHAQLASDAGVDDAGVGDAGPSDAGEPQGATTGDADLSDDEATTRDELEPSP